MIEPFKTISTIVEIKKDGKTAAICNYERFTNQMPPKEALFKVKNILDNFNKELSNIFLEKDPALSAYYIFSCENMRGSKNPKRIFLAAESRNWFKSSYKDDYEKIFSKKPIDSSAQGILAIDRTTISRFKHEVENGAAYILLDFDEKMISTKNLYKRMTLNALCKKLKASSLPSKYIEIDFNINCFYFNEFLDVFDTIRFKDGWFFKDNPDSIFICDEI